MCNCVLLRPGGSMSLQRGRGRQSPPKGVGKSPSALSSWWSECTQVLLRGPQWQTSFNREVTQSSAPVEPGARWHITAALRAAIPRMRHRGVGEFASDHREGGLPAISPNAPNANVAWARRVATASHQLGFSSLGSSFHVETGIFLCVLYT